MGRLSRISNSNAPDVLVTQGAKAYFIDLFLSEYFGLNHRRLLAQLIFLWSNIVELCVCVCPILNRSL